MFLEWGFVTILSLLDMAFALQSYVSSVRNTATVVGAVISLGTVSRPEEEATATSYTRLDV